MIVGLLISSLLAFSLVLGLAGDPAVAKKDKKKTDQQGATATAEEFDPQRDYDQTQASDEIRAYHGSIFFARVDALEGEDEEPSGGTAPPHRLLQYLVTVERSPIGPASGQVLIIYLGAYDLTVESGGFGPLRIGERYLFFAGGSGGQSKTEPQTEFVVQAGSGTILITSDRLEEELVDNYPRSSPRQMHTSRRPSRELLPGQSESVSQTTCYAPGICPSESRGARFLAAALRDALLRSAHFCAATG